MHLAEVKRIVVKKLMYYDEFGSGVPDTYEYVPLCKDCKKQYDDDACPYCNRCGRREFPPDDWFCADGVRRDD